jgi:hypothetical protein
VTPPADAPRDPPPDSAAPAGPSSALPWPEPGRGSGGVAVLGGLLVVLGGFFLVAQYLDWDLGAHGWPVYVIGPGLALVVLGLTQRHGSGLTIAGSIVTMIGLLLLYQSLTDHWESWAYAWALVAPGGSGVGTFLYGTRARNGAMARAGLWQIVVALGLFAAGFAFFEGVIGISGGKVLLPSWVMPTVVIVLGAVLLIRAATVRADVHHGESDDPAWPGSAEERPRS